MNDGETGGRFAQEKSVVRFRDAHPAETGDAHWALRSPAFASGACADSGSRLPPTGRTPPAPFVAGKCANGRVMSYMPGLEAVGGAQGPA
ncbi:hypothetical protein ACFL5O_09745 [Myxococcota bacterium]